MKAEIKESTTGLAKRVLELGELAATVDPMMKIAAKTAIDLTGANLVRYKDVLMQDGIMIIPADGSDPRVMEFGDLMLAIQSLINERFDPSNKSAEQIITAEAFIEIRALLDGLENRAGGGSSDRNKVDVKTIRHLLKAIPVE